MNSKKKMQYKMAFFVSLLGALLQLLLFYYFWNNVFYSNSDNVSFILFSRIVYIIVGNNLVWRLSARITSGNVSLDLTKPYGFFYYELLNRLSETIIESLTTGLILFFGITLLEHASFSIMSILLFILSMFLATTICFCFDYITSYLCLFTNSTWGVSAFREGLIQLFSGALFPVSFLSQNSFVLFFFPFRYIVDIPVSILFNRGNIYHLGIFQLIYATIILVFARCLERGFSKKLQLQGG